MKKEGRKLFSVFLILVLLISFFSVIAQDEEGVADDTITDTTIQSSGESEDVAAEEAEEAEEETEFKDEKHEVFEQLREEYAGEEIVDGGITPDSPFYFIDEVFDRFGDPEKNREEKIAEVKAMVEEGKIEAAKKAKERYEQYAEEIGEEADPEKREEIRRSAAVIYNTLSEIEEEIPEDEKQEFYDNIIETESSIVIAVEISDKIKNLCMQLAELDPVQYAKICKVEGDAPKWKTRLDKELTEEQKKEAKEFGEILTECFSTSGRECRCKDISFSDFSTFCEKMSFLAVKCDEGDENACMKMDEVGQDMPELPDYLMDVFYEIESNFGQAQYEMHMPEPCIEAKANPKECMLIMTEYHAPPECKAAIKKAIEEGKVKGEKDAREICGEIMMPPECQGMSPEECGRTMMPPECVEKDLDPKECKKFMDSRMMEFKGEKTREFGAPGEDCMRITNDMERLKCFESSIGRIENRYGKQGEMPEGEITWQCKEHRIHWPPDCERFMREELPEIERMEQEGRVERVEMQEREWEEYKREYRPEYIPDEYRPPEGEYIPPGERLPEGEDYEPSEGYEGPTNEYYGEEAPPPEVSGGGYEGPSDVAPPEVSEGGGEATVGSESSGGGESGGGGEAPSESGGGDESSGGEAGITGGVISIDTEFWDYYF